MIELSIRDRNHLVTLNVPGKAPIKARNGSPYFYTSMELMCTALGACFGGELVKYCTHNKINPMVFESIKVTMDNFIPIIVVQCPTSITEEQRKEIVYMAVHCPIANMLKNQPEIKFIDNTMPIEVLVDDTKRSCCGG